MNAFDSKKLRSLLALTLLSFSANAQTTSVLPCQAAVKSPCSVKGVLTLRHVYGPPWFGEHGDKAKFVIYVIRLNTPIHYCCIPDHQSDPVKDCGITANLQIFAQDDVVSESALRRLIGHEVLATGATYEAVAPMEHEPTMNLMSLGPATKHAP